MLSEEQIKIEAQKRFNEMAPTRKALLVKEIKEIDGKIEDLLDPIKSELDALKAQTEKLKDEQKAIYADVFDETGDAPMGIVTEGDREYQVKINAIDFSMDNGVKKIFAEKYPDVYKDISTLKLKNPRFTFKVVEDK